VSTIFYKLVFALLVILVLNACQSAPQATLTPEPTKTFTPVPSPTPSPTITPTPSITPTPTPDLSSLPENVRESLPDQWSETTDANGHRVLVDANNNSLWREADGAWQMAETVTIGGEAVQAWVVAESATVWDGEPGPAAVTIQQMKSTVVEGYTAVLATLGGATVQEWTVLEADSGLKFADVVFSFRDDRTGAENTVIVRYSEEMVQFRKQNKGNILEFVKTMLQPGSRRIVGLQFQAQGSTVDPEVLIEYSKNQSGLCSSDLGCKMLMTLLRRSVSLEEIVDLLKKPQAQTIDLRDEVFTDEIGNVN